MDKCFFGVKKSYFMYKYGTLTSGENQIVAQLIVEKSTHDIESIMSKNLTKEKPFIHSFNTFNNK